MIITAVLPDDIESVWHLINDYMIGAAKYTHGRFKVEDIKAQLLSNPRQQLWIAYDDKIYGAVITEVLTYPQMKTLIMHFTGGVEFAKWHNEIISVLRSFAKDNNCKTIEAFGRKGWKRIFKNDGFSSNFMFFELTI